MGVLQKWSHLEMDPVDLNNSDERDAQLNALHNWHPLFFLIHPDLEVWLDEYKGLMERYRDMLHRHSDDPKEELKNHLIEEVNMWMLSRMDEIVEEVWRDR